MNAIGAMLAAVEQQNRKGRERLKPGPERLRELAASYFTKHDFKPGDVVTWKPGLKNALFPDYGEPVVILDVMSGQIDDKSDPNNQHFREPSDIRIGVYPGENDLEGYWMDSSRFQPYREPGQEQNQKSAS